MFLPEVGSEKRVELAFVTNQGLKKRKNFRVDYNLRCDGSIARFLIFLTRLIANLATIFHISNIHLSLY